MTISAPRRPPLFLLQLIQHHLCRSQPRPSQSFPRDNRATLATAAAAVVVLNDGDYMLMEDFKMQFIWFVWDRKCRRRHLLACLPIFSLAGCLTDLIAEWLAVWLTTDLRKPDGHSVPNRVAREHVASSSSSS